MFCDGNIYETVMCALTECNISIPIYTMKDHLPGVKDVQEFITETWDLQSFE